ncbi:MAG: DMT family transporter [Treponemataceae bacterium]
MHKSYFGSVLLFLASIIWGLAYIPTRFLGEQGFGVFFELLWRFSIPVVILGLVFFNTIKKMTFEQKKYSILAGLVLFIGLFCAVQGLRIVSSPTVGFFLLSLNTILIPIYFLVRHKKNPSVIVLSASVGALIGSILMAWGDPRVPPNFGTLLCFLSTIAFSAYIVISSAVVKDAQPVGILFFHCVSFVIICIPLFLIFELKAMQNIPLAAWNNPYLWIAVFFQGLCSGTIAYLLFFWGMRFTIPAAAAIILAMQSVIGAFAEFILFGVRLMPLTLLGCILIFTSTLLVSVFPEKWDKKVRE